MGYPVCSGIFQNHIYRFDDDGNVYRYNKDTFKVEDISSQLSDGTDSVEFIKQCAYNGVDAIFFIGNTKEETKTSLFSAVLNSNNTFNFQILQDITSGKLDDEATTIISSSALDECVMLGYNTNSLGRVCRNESITKIETHNTLIVDNSFILQNESFYSLQSNGLIPYTFDLARENPKSYKFENPNIVNSNITWKITINTDASQVLFYDSNSTLQLLKLDEETSTAKLIFDSNSHINQNSTVLFQGSDIIVIDKASYNTITKSQFSADVPFTNNNSTAPIVPPNDNAGISKNPKYNPAVAGGFTALGLCIGFLVWLTLWCFKRRFRSKEKSQSREVKYNTSHDPEKTSRDDTTKVVQITPQVQNISENIPVTAAGLPVHEQFLKKRPTFRPKTIDSRVGEGNPASEFSTIFNNRYLIDPTIIGLASTNPLHHDEIFIRKCKIASSHKPALIHYFQYQGGKVKFNRALTVLNALGNQRSENIIKFIDAVQLGLITAADKGFKYMLITSYYEPSQSLSALYRQALTGTTIVNINDETFIVWTIYSLLLAVRDLHRAGYVHRFITADSFYAKSDKPTTDWLLADFDESGPAGEAYMMSADRSGYYDSTFNSTEFNYESDIWALGRVIYKVVSGGHDFQPYSSLKYSDCIEELVSNKTYERSYRDLLNGTLCNPRYHDRFDANQLVELWESRFDFSEVN